MKITPRLRRTYPVSGEHTLPNAPDILDGEEIGDIDLVGKLPEEPTYWGRI